MMITTKSRRITLSIAVWASCTVAAAAMIGADAKVVMDAVNGHSADIGFLVYDPMRGKVVDFSAPFYLMFNAYLVRADTPFQKPADLDKAGVKIAATTGQTQPTFLSETLMNATILQMKQTPNETEMDRMLAAGEVDLLIGCRERPCVRAL